MSNRFKVLKHKTVPNTYGYIAELGGPNMEIGHTNIPRLQPMTATKEALVEYYVNIKQPYVVRQLEMYDLITVELLTISL